MNWAEKSKIFKETPRGGLPKKPDPNDHWITRQEAMRLIGATDAPTIFTQLNRLQK